MKNIHVNLPPETIFLILKTKFILTHAMKLLNGPRYVEHIFVYLELRRWLEVDIRSLPPYTQEGNSVYIKEATGRLQIGYGLLRKALH
jgi:hypothetical protein